MGLDSFQKVVGYFEVLAKEPFTVSGKVYTPPESLYISPFLFRDYVCVEYCGWGCDRITLDYYASNVEKFIECYPDEAKLLEKISVTVDGKRYNYWSVPQRSGKGDSCRFLTEPKRRCLIHNENPLSCRVEPMKIYTIKGRGQIIRKPFGRGWIVRKGTKALCKFIDHTLSRTKEDALLIAEIGTIMDDFGIPNHCEEVSTFLHWCVETQTIPESKVAVGRSNLPLFEELE